MSKTTALLMALLMLLAITQGCLADDNFLWAKKAGSTSGDCGNSIVVDGSGNQIVTGTFTGTANFGSTVLVSAGNADVFVAKLNAAGDFLWAKKAGGTSVDAGKAIAVDASGNIFITGYFKGTVTFGSITLTAAGNDYTDAFIAKLNANGDFLWAKKAGGIFDECSNSIAVDGSGNIFITGYFSETATFGSITLTVNGTSGGRDIFIAKLNATGDFMWVKKAGGIDNDDGKSIAVDGGSNLLVAGYFKGTTTFGNTTLTTIGGTDAYITKLNTNGEFLWANQAGGTSITYVNSIAIDNDNNMYVTGLFQGTANFGSTALTSSGGSNAFIAKLNQTGDFLWANKAGGAGGSEVVGTSNDVDVNGNLFVTGYFKGSSANFGSTTLTSTGEYDIFIAKLSSTGDFIWVKKAGSTSEDDGYSITVDGNGNQFVTGKITGTAMFGGTALTSTGDYDVFIAKSNSSYSSPLPVIYKSIKFYNNVATNSGNPANLIQNGKKIRLKIKLANNYTQNLLTVKGKLVSNSPYATVTDNMGNYNNILQNDTAWSTDEFEIQLAEDTPENTVIPFKIEVSDEIVSGGPWISDFSIMVNQFKIQTVLIDDDNNPDSHGNDNDIAEPGETVEIIPIIQKLGTYNTSTIAGTLLSGQSITSVWNNHAGASGTVLSTYNYQNGGSGNTYTPALDFVFDYLSSAVNKLNFTVMAVTNIQYNDMGTTPVQMKFGVPFTINNGYPDDINDEAMPAILILENNYPNPFNNTTSIKFALPKNDFVTLAVYNLKGEQVAQLANEQFIAGYHTVDFNATNLTSGVYIYTLQTAGKTLVNKMLLVK